MNTAFFRTFYIFLINLTQSDDLGRIVIPKEIRKTLRIKDGDPMEIYTSKEGEVIFRKYSLMGGVSDLAQFACEALHKATGRAAVVTDRDACVAVAGVARRELADKLLSEPLERSIQARQLYQVGGGQPPVPVSDGNARLYVVCAAPILSEGDVLGAVLFAGTEEELTCGEVEVKLLQAMSGFLGRQMED